MSYFTIWHILVILCAAVLFVAICVSIYLIRDKLNIYIAMSANFIIFLIIVIASMFIVDSYTKQAKIENISTKRIYTNETIAYSGTVRNLGKYYINQCVIDVKMSAGLGKLSDIRAHLTKKNKFFSFLYENERDDFAPSKTQVVVKSLKPYEIRNFTAILDYPPNFQSVKFTHSMKCR